jgi:hypothetical protein
VTVVSNIHLNIAGWARKTYAIGARVSNAGSAYQCTTPGISTAPPTGTGSGINNGGTAVWKYVSGIDYTTMQAWADDRTRFPLGGGAPIVATLWNSGPGPVVATLGTPILTLSGHTTSNVNTITIAPAAGESFQAAYVAAPITPYAYNPANGVAFQLPPANKIVTVGSGASFTDATGNIWTISTAGLVGGQAFENGALPNGQFSSNVVKIALIGQIVWQNNSGGDWYYWSGTAWIANRNDPTVLPTATVFAGSGASFTDGSSNVWSISSGGEVLENGSPPAFSSNVAFIALVQGVIWQVNYGAQWYSWSGTAWIASTNAPVITVINCFQINDDNVILDGLQFQSPIPTVGGAIIGGTGANLSIQQCIFDCYAQSVGANPIAVSGANLSITNSLFVGRNTTAGLGMVSTLGAAGGVIANNTFVHTSAVSGQRVLDAGSNTTASSQTSINNIFYNYAIVYGCTGSGTPWLSSYCFYSAASFSGSNKGTDAGNSVYGLTSAIFVSFPTNMNPVSGSAVISAAFLDSTDIPAENDAFGNPRPQGSAWDGGAVELLAGTVISRDFVCSIEFKQSLPAIPNDDPIFPIEWRRAKIFDAVAPIDWATIASAGAVNTDCQMPLEILHLKVLDSPSAIEWLGSVAATTSTTSDSTIPLEWGTTAQCDIGGSVEVLQSMPSLLSPWAQVFGPVFGIGPYTTNPVFAISWSAGAGTGTLAANLTVPLEITAGIQVTTTAPLESNALVRRDVSGPVEWGAGTAFSADATFVIEWQRSFAADSSAPIAWLAALATPVNIAVGLEWRAAFQADAPSNVDWRASLRADSGGPVAWTQSVVAGTAIIPLGTGQSVSAYARAPLATLANIQRDISALPEWGVLFAPVGYIVPVEFGAGVLGTAAGGLIPVEWTASLTIDSRLSLGVGAAVAADSRSVVEMLLGVAANAMVPVEPLGGVAGSAAVPLEFGHLIFTIMVNATMPLEINSLVVGDIVVPIEPGATRLTLGAKLEPDSWEWQHQPETGGQLP